MHSKPASASDDPEILSSPSAPVGEGFREALDRFLAPDAGPNGPRFSLKTDFVISKKQSPNLQRFLC